jgi:serine/threonine protein phosphatase 1
VSDQQEPKRETPQRLFMIGDIHGCLRELTVLLNHLEQEAAIGSEDLVVFAGDYIDRGPESKQVIDYLLEFKQRHPQTVFLKGNHEDMLLDYLGYEGRGGTVYLVNGGEDTLLSYGAVDSEQMSNPKEFFPQEHLDFFQQLISYFAIGDWILVHAGLSPLAPLEEQDEEDLLWIRDEFIMNIHRFNKTVVFGHTPFENVLLHLPYKIGIDTGLVYGNRLSCVELINQQIFQVASGGEQVELSTFAELLGSSE